MAGLVGLAEAAGLRTIIATELTWDWVISVEALWTGIAGGVAGFGRTYRAQPPDVQGAVQRAFRHLASQAATDGILTLRHTAAYVVAG